MDLGTQVCSNLSLLSCTTDSNSRGKRKRNDTENWHPISIIRDQTPNITINQTATSNNKGEIIFPLLLCLTYCMHPFC